MINKEESLLKSLLPHVCAIIAFLAITLIYFSPVFEGKVLSQHDVKQFQGASQELREYYENEGESSAWTGSMFSGMPAYQIGIWGGSPNFLDYLEKPYKALGNNTAGPVFAAMLMAYILFCVMGFSPVVSALGAIAYSLSSYNIIILEAGHVTKAWALAYMPLIVAGVMALFREKILLGGLLMALGLALQIKNNHLQITYYTGIFCAILFIGYAVERISKKDIKSLLKASGVMVVALILAAACNMGNIYANLEMARESTRGKSELTTQSASDKQSTGLDKDYAFAWSYGKAETFSLMIPNIHGGASGGMLDKDSHLYKEMVKQGYGSQVSPKGVQAYTYWGAQPFTSGPVYFGVIICFLFLLGMIVIRSNMKWWLLGVTVLFIFLSWGKNMEWFNDLFFYHFPLYSKFRAVSTALVIPALTMVMVAVWGLKEFFSGEVDKNKLTKALYISLGITGGLCLFFWAVPGFMFNFTADSDAAWRGQMPDWFYTALIADRKDLLSSDALRSLVFVLLAGAVLFFSLRSSMEMKKLGLYSVLGVIVLVLADLWMVDTRYLDSSNFVSKSTYQTETFPQTVADKAILQDKDVSYRVLNLNNPFQESNTSYYHKSIGGYHAAKLKRYQELIENRLDKEINHVINTFSSQNPDTIMASFAATTGLNMLNTKYIIYHPEQPPLPNPFAMGNAWFVQEYKMVNNADEELAALNTLNPLQTAVVDKRFEGQLSGLTIATDSTATIELTEYKPNMLKYKSKAVGEQLAVLSEVYFSDGWQAYVDGKEAPHFRADWTLRAMRVPAGEHEIVFKFEPKAYDTSRMVATASSGILILLLIGMLIMPFVKKKEE
ncbi:hypothetical protein M2451_000815 [Dysgonomonas sp. PFB1-18]|uniref:YfhO family protein n=1 Tax=unclassified Dysgonomonas TaxID=2630389 RepID=UPI002473986E|nr:MULTISPECIES: YfhO family protein [unclassified Dysgonomonas]MDH6308504.1 hypothetical protein [Dysgonomonas sp. PF1-14]MDH6338005.1 hypothetical protein [Dysgonomonas sp. PF1-16]MDH6379502.1 hypothetical protein [Dysgonomonas sp. PFB1-18]MDH6396833.1 hypothetical protein [Dysgonomonas sp. PF1-23]